MKTNILKKVAIALVAMQLCASVMNAQEADSSAAGQKPPKDKRPVKDMFDGTYIINSQTAVLPSAHSFEFVIQHRFGLLTAEGFDLAGLYAPSNIRIGFNYSLTKNLMLGIGTTKNNMLQDLNWKYAILRQTRSSSIPVSLTYFGNATIDVRKDAFPETVDRLTYFHQLIVARKFSKNFSLQAAVSLSHFNMVDTLVKHDNICVSVAGRYKITKALAITLEYDHNLTSQDAQLNGKDVITVMPNLSFGIEAVTSAHVFQIFFTTGQSIINQYNVLYNKNDFTQKQFCIGFNMTRLWNL